MNALTPKQVLVIGPLGLFTAICIPCVLTWGAAQGAWMASFMDLMFFPWLATAAWATAKPAFDGDLEAKEKQYRRMERYAAMAGMGCLGYLAAYLMHLDSIVAAPGRWSSTSHVIVLVSLYVVGCAAIVRVGIIERLKILKERMKSNQFSGRAG